MSIITQIALVKEMLEASEASLRSAKQILNEIIGNKNTKVDFGALAQNVPSFSEENRSYENSKVIEGVFDGQGMAGKDNNVYPVPSNYASKSKLVAGDIMKLTITEDGKFLYKQIKPVERKTIVGILTKDEGKYKVIANGKAYRVLLASVTYYKGNIGDQVSIIIPDELDTEWGTIEGVIPSIGVMRSDDSSSHSQSPTEEPVIKKVRKVKKADTDDLGNLDL